MKIKREAVRQMLSRDTTARINENMRISYGFGFLTLKAHYSAESLNRLFMFMMHHHIFGEKLMKSKEKYKLFTYNFRLLEACSTPVKFTNDQVYKQLRILFFQFWRLTPNSFEYFCR